MTSDDAGHVPLPPEAPQPGHADEAAEIPPADLAKEPTATSGEPGTVSDVPVVDDVADPHPPAPEREWWRGDAVRDEWRDTWQTQGGEAAAAAQEVGYQLQQAAGTISDAVAATVYPAASKRGLDIRWMRLAINIPAIVLALLATWGGRTATDRMVHTIATDGPFAPLGVVLFFVLLFAIVLVLPIGTPLAHALAHLVQWAAQGLITVVRRGWRTPVVGYLMRLLVAVFIWAFVFGTIRVAGRAILHWLTGA